MHLSELLQRLKHIKRNGNGWSARCPAHNDRNPSLSVSEEGCKILLHCHAGCTTEAVCDSLGIEVSDLFTNGSSGSTIGAVHDYHDEMGKLLYQVVRYVPKSFRQRRPDGRGGWIANLKGTRRVLYRLPELLNAPSVLVCEGEKDCDRARRLGFVATCNSGGAEKWRDEYSEALRGKNVFIIADADDPGRKHAQQVAKSVIGKAALVKVLELPGAKDLSEWAEHDGTREALETLIAKAPQWKPSPVPKTGFHLTTLRDLLNEPEEDVSFLLGGKLPVGGFSVLSAKPKVGKSTFARNLALAVAKGETFLGCDTTQGPVIYFALEEKRSEVARHFRDLGATGDEPIFIHAASAPQDAIVQLHQLIKDIKPVLVVIDPLFKFVRVRDEKAYAEVSAALDPLLALARETGTHVLVTHHNVKGERLDPNDAILGSTAIFGNVDTAIVLKKTDRYRTIQSTQRYGTDWPETVLVFDDQERSLSLGSEKSDAEVERIADAIVTFLTACREPATRVEIEGHVEGKTKHKRSALKRLIEGGNVAECGAGAKGDLFRYCVKRTDQKTSVDSCSSHIEGTREQQSQNCDEALINTGHILVPNTSNPTTEKKLGKSDGHSLPSCGNCGSFAVYRAATGMECETCGAGRST